MLITLKLSFPTLWKKANVSDHLLASRKINVSEDSSGRKKMYERKLPQIMSKATIY